MKKSLDFCVPMSYNIIKEKERTPNKMPAGLRGGRKMKVKVFVINEGTTSEFYGLKNAEENTVLYGAPNNWKTKKGAMNWATKNRLEIAE